MRVVHPLNLEALLPGPGKRGQSGWESKWLKPVLLKGVPSHLQPSNTTSPRQVPISPGKETTVGGRRPLLLRDLIPSTEDAGTGRARRAPRRGCRSLLLAPSRPGQGRGCRGWRLKSYVVGTGDLKHASQCHGFRPTFSPQLSKAPPSAGPLRGQWLFRAPQLRESPVAPGWPHPQGSRAKSPSCPTQLPLQLRPSSGSGRARFGEQSEKGAVKKGIFRSLSRKREGRLEEEK